MPFDRIERSTGLLRKIKFYVYGTFIMASFFLLIYFLVAED